ncbi:MAG: hypothetical protein IJK18_08875 [Clostridia bacterium]|nr:hypothetical protein [Clostridia bacterium]
MITLILLISGTVFILAGAACLLIEGLNILFDVLHYENNNVDKILNLLLKIAMMLVAFSVAIFLIFYVFEAFIA